MKLRYIFLLLCMLPLLTVPVTAHPGKTDSSGGHTDHETGSYHYHHGYPAHQHYDKDGDGKPDCPYKFVDKTDHSSNNTTDKAGSSKPSNNTHPNSTQKSKSTSFFTPNNFFWSFLIACGLCFFVLVFVRKMEIRFSSGKSYSAFLVAMDLEVLALAFFTSCFYMPGDGFDASLVAQAKIWEILSSAFYLGVVMYIFWFCYHLLVLFAFSDIKDSSDATDKLSLNLAIFSIIAYLYFLVANMFGFISVEPLYSWLR